MIRVHVICEGQTEEMFVNEVLAEPFLHSDIHLIPSLVGKPGHKGGNFKFERLLTDVRSRLKDKNAYCTTFFDFYGLPASFPGKQDVLNQFAIEDKSEALLAALVDELKAHLGEDPLRRFIPYVQMYEFEALLFSHPGKLASGIGRTDLRFALQQIRDSFDCPEEINNSNLTAPSKRILELYPAYQKPLHGTLAALEIGLGDMRSECRLFDGWLSILASLKPL